MSDLKEVASLPVNFTKLTLASLLREKYPSHHWEKVYLLRGRYSHQKRLRNVIDEYIFLVEEEEYELRSTYGPSFTVIDAASARKGGNNQSQHKELQIEQGKETNI